jgi:hypothetical protein
MENFLALLMNPAQQIHHQHDQKHCSQNSEPASCSPTRIAVITATTAEQQHKKDDEE